MRAVRKSIFAILLMGLVGCQVPTTVALRGGGGRNAFNQTLQMTTNEQLLLNLVRLRYCDTPYFLNVTNITNQVSYESEANAKFFIPGFSKGNPTALGGALSWKSQPTIVYTPVEGKQFSELLLKPIDLVFIQQLVYSGWDIDRVFKLSVQSFDNMYNAPTASGPFPNTSPVYRKFYRVTQLLRHFQKLNQLQVGVHSSLANEDSKIQTGCALQIYFPDNGNESKELAKLLGNLQSSEGYYVINIKLGFQKKGQVGIMPRSILSCMYYLSLGVDVPDKHEANSIGITTICDDQCPFEWKEVIQDLICINHSKSEPSEAAVKVKYRNYWFYIDETDISSKRTFVLLLNLFNLQAGSSEQKAPILTIPVGV
ncbi:MAG: hypothetical protein P0S95_06940 [Rhabdochlamydiaceae bacterium]|nr:hypothetical protein [Candidatus Amphrikana amoebophyrae]